MPYSAKAVANYFLDRGLDEDVPIDPLKLQKLVYFAYGWSLGLTNTPLLGEQVYAWQYGPVFQSLYHQFKEFGDRPIGRHAREEATGAIVRIPPDDHRVTSLLDRIWSVYSRFTGLQLSDMTHKKGTPWAETWAAAKGQKTPIPDEDIAKYFSSVVRS